MLSQIIKCARLYADSFMVFVQLSFGEFLTSELANHLTTGNVQFSTVIISGPIFSTSWTLWFGGLRTLVDNTRWRISFLLFWQDQNEEENWASWWYSFFQDESWHFLVLHAMLVFCWRRSDLTRILKFGCDWVEWNMNHGQTYAFLLNVNPHFFLALKTARWRNVGNSTPLSDSPSSSRLPLMQFCASLDVLIVAKEVAK